MAFVNPIDPATPADSDLASQGDDRIRELKAGMLERLSQVILGWPDTDPLKLKTSALDVPPSGTGATLVQGTLAARPVTPASTFYWATDTNALYVNEGGAWEQVAAGVGAAIPFSGMKGTKLTGSNTVVGVPNHTGGELGLAYTMLLGSGLGLTVNDVIIGLKYKPTKVGTAALGDWAQHTSSNTTSAGVVNRDYIVADAGLTVSVSVSRYFFYNTGGEVVVAINGYIHNTSGAAVDVNIDFEVFVLKAT